MYQKMDKTVYRSCICNQPRFSAYWSLQENQVHYSKEPKIVVWKQHFDFTYT